MKIAIVSNDGEMINPHFGSSRGFVIIEVENNKEVKREYRSNTFTSHATGGGEHNHGEHAHDHHSPILAALADVQVVIGGGMGRRLVIDLESAGKKLYITDEPSVNGALARLLDGSLVHLANKACAGGTGGGCH